MNILIAQDQAFNFTYRANIDTLRHLGQVTFFSPLHHDTLPPCDLLYLPGGYPELFSAELSSQENMRKQIRDYAEEGGRIFAECGGFMYLCQDIDGHPMCGVLPLRATMNGAHLHLGYRQMRWKGELIKGHEFHYSSIVSLEEWPESVKVLHLQQSANGRRVDTPIYHYKNVIAGYTHWYWADKEELTLQNLFEY